jgi:molecular chaperone DnaK (HSP70)
MSNKNVLEELDSDEFDNYFTGERNNIEAPTDVSDEDLQSDNDENTDEPEIIVGIDLGTTNSCVSIWRNNNLEIIPDSFGYRTIPSIVAFTNKSKYVGREAKNQTDINPENTYYEVKRLIGRKFNDDSVTNDIPFLTYGVAEGDDGSVVLTSSLTSRKKKITPEEISAHILMELKYMAEDYLKKPVEKAVITVPAYFNDSQRQATKDAATIAGLDCVRIINEPTAAALSYGLQRLTKNKEEDINIIVYDLGGGTLDVSLLNISDGLFEVLGSTGNTHLGGADFDNRLVTYCKNEFKKKNKIKQLKDLSLLSLQKLKKACENAKKMLSETWKTTIAVKEFYNGINLIVQITKKEFELLCRDLFILCIKPLEDIMTSSGLERGDIDDIILVGGGTRMPAIRENIKLYFSGKEPNCTVNPDEVVSAGAAIQGYILSHKKDPFAETVVLLDVIPLSLGVETIGGVMTTLIPRNSVIPIKRTKKFTTDRDYEDSVKIEVYEGERTMTKDNFLVGEFILNGLEKAPRGIAEIDVTFSIDINGIISVTAEDKKNNDNKKTITITGNKGRLKPEEIKNLVNQARELEKRDKIEREKRQLFYQIEDMCSNVKININNDEFKLKEKDRELVLSEIAKIYEWLEAKPYLERTTKEYSKLLKRLTKKYGTLILRISHDNDNVKAKDESGSSGTTIYGNDADDAEAKEIYEKLENEELGIDSTIDQQEKEEIKQTRDNLIELCHSIFEVINSDTMNISDKDIKDLRDYIDDVLLWTHVVEKIPKSEYRQKIDEINKTCDEIFKKYENNIFHENAINDQIKTKRNELEQLCFAIKSSIASNLFSIKEDAIVNLDTMINVVFDWLISIDVQQRKAELSGEEFKIDESEYQSRIDAINDLCNNLYNSMIGVNIAGNNDVVIDEEVIYLTHDQPSATTQLEVNSGKGTTLDALRDLESAN